MRDEDDQRGQGNAGDTNQWQERQRDTGGDQKRRGNQNRKKKTRGKTFKIKQELRLMTQISLSGRQEVLF